MVPTRRRRRSTRPLLAVLALLAAGAIAVLLRHGESPGTGGRPEAFAPDAVVSWPDTDRPGPDGDTGAGVVPPAESAAARGGLPDDPDTAAASLRFAVAIGPPVFTAPSAEMAGSLRSVHAAFVRGLREIPHLDLIAIERVEGDGPPDGADFLLRVSGEAPSVTDPRWTFRVSWQARGRSGEWSGSRDAGDSEPLEAMGEEAAAALGSFPFPPRETRVVELEAVAVDASLPQKQRFAALDELAGIPERYGFIGVEAAARVAIIAADIVAKSPEPAIRARAWRALYLADIDETYLTSPLVDSLLNDEDEAVRLEAAKLLAANFDDDARATSALEYALLADTSPRVRANVRWEMLDEQGRRNYVAATLLNTELSDAERLELLVADVRDLNSYVDRGQAMALARMAGAGRNGSSAETGQYAPLLLQLLQEGETVEIRLTAASMLSRSSDPAIQEALREAARAEESFLVRNMISGMLQR